jgi:hypothetical protein
MRTTIQLRMVALALLLPIVQSSVLAQERNLGEIDGGVTIVVDKPVDKLVVKSINGKSTLIVKARIGNFECGLVDGRSNVIIKDAWNVDFRDRIDGRSLVLVKADNIVRVREINGRSRVRVKCKDFFVGDKIDGGPCTQVLLDGAPHVDHVNGGAQFRVEAIKDLWNMRTFPFDTDCADDPGDENKIIRRAIVIEELIKQRATGSPREQRATIAGSSNTSIPTRDESSSRSLSSPRGSRWRIDPIAGRGRVVAELGGPNGLKHQEGGQRHTAIEAMNPGLTAEPGP